MSLISKIQSLISSANAVTGESRTDLTSAVQDLKDGYGGSTVEKGLVFSDYDSDGYPHKAEFVGSWTSIPSNYLRQAGASNRQILSKITHLDIPEGVTTLGQYSLYSTTNLRSITLPSTLTTISDYVFYGTGLTSIEIPSGVTAIPQHSFNIAQSMTQVVMKGDIATIGRSAFRGMTVCDLYDFSNCTSVPSLYDADVFILHKTNCVIRVPQSLLAEWQTTTNWIALTDVVWQGV